MTEYIKQDQALERAAVALENLSVNSIATPQDAANFLRSLSSLWELQPLEPVKGEPYDKTEMNFFVQTLYDQKMREGKHGHYETMFHVVHKAIERAVLEKARNV